MVKFNKNTMNNHTFLILHCPRVQWSQVHKMATGATGSLLLTQQVAIPVIIHSLVFNPIVLNCPSKSFSKQSKHVVTQHNEMERPRRLHRGSTLEEVGPR